MLLVTGTDIISSWQRGGRTKVKHFNAMMSLHRIGGRGWCTVFQVPCFSVVNVSKVVFSKCYYLAHILSKISICIFSKGSPYFQGVKCVGVGDQIGSLDMVLLALGNYAWTFIPLRIVSSKRHLELHVPNILKLVVIYSQIPFAGVWTW